VEMSMANTATNVSTTLANMQLAEINAQQNTVGKLNGLADVEQLYLEAKRLFDVDTVLYVRHVIGLQEYTTAANNYRLLKQKLELQKEILHEDTLSRNQQAQQDKESYDRAKETLKIMQEKVGMLTVTAPISGQLTSLDAEIGQTKTTGYPLAQIDSLGGFYGRYAFRRQSAAGAPQRPDPPGHPGIER
jgi:HlyD family secretion protein